MATWITHMRIAEHFINNYNSLDKIDFLVGNIAPDSGVPNEDWSKFSPDSTVSHWQLDGININADDFFNKYINGQNINFSFYLGYYFHLLTDIEWKNNFFQNKMKEPIYYENMNKDNNFIWIIKKDWYGQDHNYLKENPNSIFFKIFSKIKEYDNKYLEIFPKNAFMDKINYITNFYLNANEDSEREYPYLKKEEIDYFVNNTIKILEKKYNEINNMI